MEEPQEVAKKWRILATFLRPDIRFWKNAVFRRPCTLAYKIGGSHHDLFLYSAFAGYRDIPASLMVILTAKNPPQIQANTTKGS